MASDKSRVTKKILDYFSERMKEWTLNNASGSSVTEERVTGIEADIEALETSMDDMDGVVSGEGGLSERVQALEDAGTGGGESVTLADLGVTTSAASLNKVDSMQTDINTLMNDLYCTYDTGKALVHYQEVSFTVSSATASDTTYNTYINKTSYKILGYAVVGKYQGPVAVEFYANSSYSYYQMAIRPYTTNTASVSYPVTGTVYVIYST